MKAEAAMITLNVQENACLPIGRIKKNATAEFAEVTEKNQEPVLMFCKDPLLSLLLCGENINSLKQLKK